MNSYKPLSPEFRELTGAIRAEAAAGRNEERSEDRRKSWREWITIALLALNLGAIAAQVREMRLAYGPIKAQADAMKKAADAATKQTQQAEQTAIEAERAWIGPTTASIGPLPDEGKPPQTAAPVDGKGVLITVAYQNSGHEPGLNFHSTGDILIFKPSKTTMTQVDSWINTGMQRCKNNQDPPGGAVAYPSAGGLGGNGYSYQLRTANTYGKDATVFVQGCFQYRTFNMSKHSYFCYYYAAEDTRPENLNICDNGHDAN